MSTITATRLAVNKNKRKLGTPIEATTEEDFTMVKLAHCYQDSSTNALSRNGQRYPITPLTPQPRQPECAGVSRWCRSSCPLLVLTLIIVLGPSSSRQPKLCKCKRCARSRFLGQALLDQRSDRAPSFNILPP